MTGIQVFILHGKVGLLSRSCMIVFSLVTWTVKVYRCMNNYKDNNQVLRPREKYFDSLYYLKIKMLHENLQEVNLKYSRTFNNVIMPPLM